MFWKGNEYDHIVYFLNEITKATGLVAMPETIGWYPGPVFPLLSIVKEFVAGHKATLKKDYSAQPPFPCWPCPVTFSAADQDSDQVSHRCFQELSLKVQTYGPQLSSLSLCPSCSECRCYHRGLWAWGLGRGWGARRRMSPGVPDTSDQPPRLPYPGATTKTTQNQNQNQFFRWQKDLETRCQEPQQSTT